MVHARHAQRMCSSKAGDGTFPSEVLRWHHEQSIHITSVYMPHVGRPGDDWEQCRRMFHDALRRDPMTRSPLQVILGDFNVRDTQEGGVGEARANTARGLTAFGVEAQRAQGLLSCAAEHHLQLLHPDGPQHTYLSDDPTRHATTLDYCSTSSGVARQLREAYISEDTDLPTDRLQINVVLRTTTDPRPDEGKRRKPRRRRCWKHWVESTPGQFRHLMEGPWSTGPPLQSLVGVLYGAPTRSRTGAPRKSWRS